MKKIRTTAILLLICMTVSIFVGCAKIETAMEYKGEKISLNLYSYWMSQNKSRYVTSENDTDEYWATKYSNGETYEQKMREIVDFNVKVNLVCQKLFKDMGLELNAEDVKELETGISDLLKAYGSKSELNKFLSKYNINYGMLSDIYKIELMTATVYDTLYAKNGERYINDQELENYFKENYVQADMIILYTPVEYVRNDKGEIEYDEATGNAKTRELTEEEIAAKKALAEDIVKKLDNGESFEDLKNQYNEDANGKTYTEGYFISTNDLSVYGPSIVAAAAGIKVDEYKMVEDGSSICIMKRKELNTKAYLLENYKDMLGSLRDYCQQSDFNTYMFELIKDVVVYDEVTSKISVKEAELMG